MLTVLFILGALCPLNFAEIPIKVLSSETDGVLAGRFPNSFLLKLPDCTTYGNKSAELLYIELPSTENNTKTFKVPSCPVSLPGYLLNGLKSGTTYKYTFGDNMSGNIWNSCPCGEIFWSPRGKQLLSFLKMQKCIKVFCDGMMYKIDNETSAVLTDSTTTVIDYQEINSGLPARSGAMVVITVILSLAMVALVAGLIVTVFFSG